MFTGEGHKVSIEQCDLEEFTKDKPSTAWPSLSAVRLAAGGMQWRMAIELGGEWSQMRRAWLSLMCEPGTLLVKSGLKVSWIVFKVSCFGVALLRTTFSGAGHSLGVAPMAKPSVSFEVVVDVQAYKVADVRLLAPGEREGDESCANKIGLTIGKRTSLLRHAASKGFRNFGTQQLRRLAQELGVEVRRGASEAVLLECLVKHAFGADFTQELLKGAALARQMKVFDAHPCAPACGADLGDLLAEDVGDDLEDDCSDIQHQLSCRSALRRRRRRRRGGPKHWRPCWVQCVLPPRSQALRPRSGPSCQSPPQGIQQRRQRNGYRRALRSVKMTAGRTGGG